MRRFGLVVALLIFSAGLIVAQEPHEGARFEQHTTKDPWFWWKLGNFAILAGLVTLYMIKKRGGEFFERRTEAIQAGMMEAEKARREAEQRVSEMERRIANLGGEIESLRTTVRHEMAAEGERIGHETERHIKRIQTQAEQEIESMTKRARRDLKMYAAGLALESAERQLKSRVTKDVEDRLVASFIDGMRSRSANN
jgi:F-type H+-transporting ATPase subunit b